MNNQNQYFEEYGVPNEMWQNQQQNGQYTMESVYEEQGQPMTQGQQDKMKYKQADSKEFVKKQRVFELLETIKPIATYKESFKNNRINNVVRLSTGMKTLDIALNGGLSDELYIMAAESSTGKSAFFMSLAQSVAEKGNDIDVLYFALEMGRDEIIARAISRISHEHHMRDKNKAQYTTAEILYWKYEPTAGEGAFTTIPYSKYEEYSEEYFSRFGDNLHIIEGGVDGLTVTDIANVAAIKKRRDPKRKVVVFIDYLQLVKADPDDRSQVERKGKIDAVVTTLKALASQIGMPVLTISSIARAGYKSKVSMESFKESGDTEYTGGILLGWNWDRVSDSKNDEARNAEKAVCEERGFREMTLEILKYRNAARDGAVHFKYYPAYNYFEEFSPKEAKSKKIIRK